MVFNLLRRRQRDGGGDDDVRVLLLPAQQEALQEDMGGAVGRTLGGVRRRGGRRQLQQNEPDAFEVQVLREARRVPGPGREAVAGPQQRQVSGFTPPAEGRSLRGGTGRAVEEFDDGTDNRKAPLEKKKQNIEG